MSLTGYWQTCPMSGRTSGLDWQKIESIFRLKKQDTTLELIEQLQAIEEGALAQIRALQSRSK